MSKKIKFNLHLASFLIILFLLVWPKNAYGADLTAAKDTISTSRPSASAPLSTDLSANATSFTFDNNSSKYLASDSATFMNDTGETRETVTVASQSGTTVFLATKNANTHHKGSAIAVPITARHVVQFTTINSVPSGGKIKVFFPVGDTTNQASPSASGFSFNGLNSLGVGMTGTTCSSWTVTAATGLVQCTLGVAISSPTALTINIGSGATGPVLINPTKTAVGGTADVWNVTIRTTDGSDVDIDSAKVKIGTVESVSVYATVDPLFTFQISGLPNGAAINAGNATGCTNTETINTGFTATSTEVNLGVLGSGTINISSQLITITTNGEGGYTLTATSSGLLINPASGYWIANAQGNVTTNDLPVPLALTAGTTAFGIHPCGLDVTTGTWGSGATGGGINAKYANPSATYYYTLASDTAGPVGNSVTAGNGLVSVEYAATISSAVPAGIYRTAMTFVATPSF